MVDFEIPRIQQWIWHAPARWGTLEAIEVARISSHSISTYELFRLGTVAHWFCKWRFGLAGLWASEMVVSVKFQECSMIGAFLVE